MEYIATFFTHYGAVQFYQHCRRLGVQTKMAPVPRELSASCGTCVRFAGEAMPACEEQEDMEGCYRVAENGGYILEKNIWA